MPIVKATFDTRQEAELAIEHLVQEYELDRNDIVVRLQNNENSVGIEPGGSVTPRDSEPSNGDYAALEGSISVLVTVDYEEKQLGTVQELLEEFGGRREP